MLTVPLFHQWHSSSNPYQHTQHTIPLFALTKGYRFLQRQLLWRDNDSLLGENLTHLNLFDNKFSCFFSSPTRRLIFSEAKPFPSFDEDNHDLQLTDGSLNISRNNEEWQRVRQALAPKVMRPKVLEENIDNFNAVTRDAVKRLVKIRETNGEVPDLEGELSKWSTEGT